ncbi:uncharacterized protein JCM15063_001046 [Sporobolomyces koalae]|uniref:uncharacterized protein n=1 Tax=Sporobolomyces koalae TaxID=500713 RepID=UPI0031822232
MTSASLSHYRRLVVLSFVLATLVSSSTALPGRFPCGTVEPNQHICDSLASTTSSRVVGVPVGSQCVEERGLGYFCGWQGARCTADNQCDFGQCTGTLESPGICVGGLGDLCEGPDGPDDTLCAGNLGCQRTSQGEGIVGKAVCGGSGADCSYEGAYQIGTKPNHSACLSKHCSSRSLTCTTPNRPRPGRPQIRFDVPVPKSAPTSSQQNSKIVIPSVSSCPSGFTICPVARPGLDKGYEMACFNTVNSATHCGGCPPIGAGFWSGKSAGYEEQGVDCTALSGVLSSDCVDSKCRIFSCSPNYDFDRKTGTCQPKKYW